MSKKPDTNDEALDDKKWYQTKTHVILSDGTEYDAVLTAGSYGAYDAEAGSRGWPPRAKAADLAGQFQSWWIGRGKGLIPDDLEFDQFLLELEVCQYIDVVTVDPTKLGRGRG